MKNINSRITKIVVTFTLSIIVFLIPSVLVNSMLLEEAIPHNYGGIYTYEYPWMAVTAAIFMGKCICSLVAGLILYKGVLMLLEKE